VVQALLRGDLVTVRGSRQQQARLVDRLLASVGLVFAAPVLGLAALGIKVSDRGPVLYRAQRVGLGGRPFTMLKLRTMRSAPGGESSRITGGTDTRVFPLGRLLRRFKLDELPQLVNVLRGDMAIVGPRPEDPSIVERDYAPWMHETLSVLPGLTSPGTLHYYADEAGLPGNGSDAEAKYLRVLLSRKLAVDLVYVRNRSIGYDAALIVRTLASLLGAHGAFHSTRVREQNQAHRILREEGLT